MAELIVYSSASDGSNYKVATDTYINVQGAAAASHDRGAAGDSMYPQNAETVPDEFAVERGYLYFDLSAMAGGTITGIIASLVPHSRGETNTGHPDLWLVEGVQGDPYDHNDFGAHLTKTTKGHDTAFDASELILDSHNAKALNATAIAWAQAALDASLDFKLCIRTHGDIEVAEPSGANYVQVYTTDKGGDFRPKLVITYTPPVAVGRSFGFIIG